MNKRLAIFFLIFFIFLITKVQAEQFDRINLHSQTVRYDPTKFSFSEDNPFYEGNTYCFMQPWLWVSGPENSSRSVYLNSDNDIFNDFEVTYRGNNLWTNNIYWDLLYNDMPEEPQYPYPGSQWENSTYTFSFSDDDGPVSQNYFIPSGSLRQLSVPDVTIAGVMNPNISWLPVQYAHFYDIWFWTIDENGRADEPIYSSAWQTSTTYNYTGDLFQSGDEYIISVRATEIHPYGQWWNPDNYDPLYHASTINRSIFSTKYSAPVPEPATMLLLGSGLIGLAGFRRKYRRR